jgi:hypothetical protein
MVRPWFQTSLTLAAGGYSYGVVSMGVGSFTSAFDSFLSSWDLMRFDEVEVLLRPTWNSVGGGTTTLPIIVHTPNFDDLNVPTTFDQVAGINTARIETFDHPIRRRLAVPSLLAPAVASGTPPALLLPGSWLNSSQLASSAIILPLMKYAVYCAGPVPGNGTYMIQLVIHFSVVQPIMG